MAMTFVVTLTCPCCKAGLRFENERPAWKTYDYRVERSNDIEAAARFVQEHADEDVPEPGDVLPEEWRLPDRVWEFVFAPNTFARRDRQTGMMVCEPGRADLHIPDSYLYVDCPVCDGHIRKPKP